MNSGNSWMPFSHSLFKRWGSKSQHVMLIDNSDSEGFLKLRQWSVNRTCYGWLNALTPICPKEGLIPWRTHHSLLHRTLASFSQQKTPSSPANSMWVSAGMHTVIHLIVILSWFQICMQKGKTLTEGCYFYAWCCSS